MPFASQAFHRSQKTNSTPCTVSGLESAEYSEIRSGLTSAYLILSSYMYWGPGAFFPMFSVLVSSASNFLQPSQRLAWGKLNCACDFSTDSGSLPNEVCACSESKAYANAVRSIYNTFVNVKSLSIRQSAQPVSRCRLNGYVTVTYLRRSWAW